MDLSFLHWLEKNPLWCANMTLDSKLHAQALVVFDTSSLLVHSNNPTGSVPDGSTSGIQAYISLECIILNYAGGNM